MITEYDKCMSTACNKAAQEQLENELKSGKIYTILDTAWFIYTYLWSND